MPPLTLLDALALWGAFSLTLAVMLPLVRYVARRFGIPRRHDRGDA
jgi:hypothetical protein